MTPVLRAKFKCINVTTGPDGDEKLWESVELNAVYATEGENASWSKWTPSGSVKMSITNAGAFGKLEQGREYYIDFTLAHADGPGTP